MHIIVPVKQVPETTNVRMDPETGTMIREGLVSIVNPLDLYAIETAIELKERTGGRVTVVTMGPPSAEAALREAIAMGCDQGILLSDRRFAGSDTWATSRALSRLIGKMEPYDLIICGERATDGDTGQVGPGIAAWLDLPVATYVSRLLENRASDLVVERLVEDGYVTWEIDKPCVLTVIKEAACPRLPTLRGKQRARRADIPVWSAEDIGVEPRSVGLRGSPTRVVRIQSPKVTREGDIRAPRDAQELEAAVDGLVAWLETLNVLSYGAIEGRTNT